MKTTKLTVASLTPDCGAILGPSLAGCDCKCLPRRHICTKKRHARAQSAPLHRRDLRPKERATKATMPRGVVLCFRDGIDRSLPHDAQLRPNKGVWSSCLRARLRIAHACISNMRCFVGATQSTRSRHLPQICYQGAQARRRRNNQTRATGRAAGDARIVLANGHPASRALIHHKTSSTRLASRRTWKTCHAHRHSGQHRCIQLPSQRNSAHCQRAPSKHLHRGKL